ncbi:4Fe-4S dicluster domain-containing protein [Chloroflexota bacterium]
MNEVLLIDPSKCTGCRSCEVVCSMVKEGEVGIYNSRIKTQRFPDEIFFLPRVCFQCDSPYCIPACPSEAISKNRESGVVTIDAGLCTGCSLCLDACPFGAITMPHAVAVKCDLCGGEPECVKYCEAEAITYDTPREISRDKKNVIAVLRKLGTLD